MAFNKDTKTLGAVGNFRQFSGQQAKNVYNKKKGGGIPYFVDMFQPPQNDLCVARLIPGAYEQFQVAGEGDNITVEKVISPFIKFVDHFDGHVQKGAICSAGPLANIKDRRDPCHGCDIYWATVARNANGRLESSRMSRQNKYVFSVFDYSPYHKLEQFDQDTGKMRMNLQTNEPYYNWVRCEGQGCDACRAGKEWKRGHASHWPINFTQLQVLRGAENNIGTMCKTCQQPDAITSLGWMCRGCGEGIIDMASSNLKKDELLKITDELYSCTNCQSTAFLEEVFECRVCSAHGKTGQRATLFDVDLKLQLVRGGSNNAKVLQIAGWSTPYPIDPVFTEAKPQDLLARYTPPSMDFQMERFGPVPLRQTPEQVQQQQQQQQQGPRTYVNPYGQGPDAT